MFQFLSSVLQQRPHRAFKTLCVVLIAGAVITAMLPMSVAPTLASPPPEQPRYSSSPAPSVTTTAAQPSWVTLEDFSDGDISEYADDTDNASVSGGELVFDSGDSQEQATGIHTNTTLHPDNPDFPDAGDTIRYNLRYNNSSSLITSFGFGAGKNFEVDPIDNQISFGSESPASASLQSNVNTNLTVTITWYKNDTLYAEVSNSSQVIGTVTGNASEDSEYLVFGADLSGTYGYKYWYDNVDVLPAQPDVSGTVRDQNGDPVNNASVVAMAYYPNLSEDTSKLRQRLQDVKPDVWRPNLDLLGSDGKFKTVDGTYVAVHTSSDWNLNRFQADGAQILAGSGPDLDTPNLVVDSDKQLILTAWDAQNEGLVQDGVDSDLPGATTTGKIVVQRIDGANQTLEEFTLETQPFFRTHYGPGTYVNPVRKTHEAAVVNGLPVGFYRVFPKGNPAASYVLAVAPNRNLNKMDLQPWVQGLKTKLGDLSARAKAYKDITNKSGVAVRTTTTNESGYYEFNYGKTPNEVALKAIRPPEGMNTSHYTGTHPNAGELKTYMDNQIQKAKNDIESIKDQNLTVQNPVCGNAAPEIGSAYLPANGPTVSPPEQNVNIEMREVTTPNFMETANQLCMKNSVREQLLNSSLSGLLGRANLSALSTAELRSLLTDLKKGMIDNPDVCKRWARNMGASGSQLEECESGTDENGDGRVGGAIPTNPQDAARETVENAVNSAEETIENTADTVDDGVPEVTSPDGDVSVNGDNITVEYDTGMETVVPDDVFVRIHFSNGTTKIVSGNSSHVVIDERVGRSTLVRLEDYPLGDAASAEVEFSVFGSEGLASGSVTARNPTFQGTVPPLDAIRLSSSQPGPNERVVVDPIPGESSKFGSVTDISVQGPDGSAINTTNVTNGKASFTTNGAGVYRAEVQFTNPAGKTFTEVISIRAGKKGVDRPPTIRAASGPTGLFAIVSDGLVAGSLQTSNAGETVTARGLIGADADVPSSVHVHTQELEVQRGHTTTIQLLRAPDESQLSKRTGDVLHEPAISSDGFGYRIEDGNEQALPQNGSGQYGTLRMQSNQTVVETYSDPTGSISVQLVNEPGTLDTIAYETCLRVGVLCGGFPSTSDLPFGWTTPALDVTILALGGVVVGRRRWSA